MTHSRPTVVFFEPIAASAMDRMRASADVSVADPDDPTAADVLRTADAAIVRSRFVGAEIADRCPRLTVLGRHGVGLDTIDLDAMAARDITVVNTPRANAESVAEFAVTAILMLVKRIVPASAMLGSGRFDVPKRSLPSLVQERGLVGRDLAALTVGVVGYGAIGQQVVTRLRALGTRCLVHDPYVRPDRQDGVESVEKLDDLLTRSDVVTLHVPGGADGRPLIDQARLDLMPPGAYLVNTARGQLVDEDALVDAVRSGRLGGALVDVFTTEPPPATAAVLNTPGLVATPHMAAMTVESLERMGREVVDGVLSALVSRTAG